MMNTWNVHHALNMPLCTSPCCGVDDAILVFVPFAFAASISTPIFLKSSSSSGKFFMDLPTSSRFSSLAFCWKTSGNFPSSHRRSTVSENLLRVAVACSFPLKMVKGYRMAIWCLPSLEPVTESVWTGRSCKLSCAP